MVVQFVSTMMRYFDEVARHGSVRKAASRLNISASAVNRQILLLEESLGISLFERIPRGMRVTEAGSILLAALQRFKNESSVALSQVDALRSLKRGNVSIGSLLFLSESFFPNLIQRLRILYPDISYTIFFGSSDDIISGVIDGNLDLGLCWNPPPSSPVSRFLTKKIPLGVAALPDHPIADRTSVRLRDLLGYPVIFPAEGTDLRDILDRINIGKGKSLSPAVTTTSMSMMRHLAVAGLGVALVNQAAIMEDIRAGRLVLRPLNDPGAQTLTLSLFTRAERELPVASEMVLNHLLNAFSELVSDQSTVGRPTRSRR
jgi:DNA-binding transcriptional LysR family regulator